MPPEHHVDTSSATPSQTADDTLSWLARLQTVAGSLARVADPAQVAEIIATQGVAAYGAGAGSLSLRAKDAADLGIVAAVGYPPEVVDRFHRYALDSSVPLAQVARTGVPLWVESAEE